MFCAGTERSGSSFSSGVTGRLTYADLGGAAWGAPLDAKAGASLVPPVTSFPAPSLAAFGPVGSKQASSGNGISQLWAPDSPGTDAAVLSHKQQRHKREVSLSDLGYLGFVSRNEHTGGCLPIDCDACVARCIAVFGCMAYCLKFVAFPLLPSPRLCSVLVSDLNIGVS